MFSYFSYLILLSMFSHGIYSITFEWFILKCFAVFMEVERFGQKKKKKGRKPINKTLKSRDIQT